jgi:hypothetical protein
MAGSRVVSISQPASFVGHACEVVVGTKPPLPEGAGYLAMAALKLAYSGSSSALLPLILTIP